MRLQHTPILAAVTLMVACFSSSAEVVATSQPSADVFTIDDVAKIRAATEARISPDGQLIAWVRSVPRDPKAKGDGVPYKELHVVDRQGRNRAFVHGKTSVFHVRWTPDGLNIAFLSKRGGDKKAALWLIAANGGEAWKGLSLPDGIRAFALHPDGKTVLALGQEKLAKDRKKQREHGFNQRIIEEQERPWQVYRGTLTRPLSLHHRPKTKSPKPASIRLSGSASTMAISPDGKVLAVALAPTSRVDDHLMKRALHLVDLTSGKVIGKLQRKGKLGRFWWSPDSKHLAVIGAEDEHDPRAGRLWLLDARGKWVRDLVPKYKGHIFNAVWRDAQTLLYVASHNERTDLQTVTVAGKVTGLPAFQSGIIHAMTVSRDGKTIAATVDSPKHPSEVFAIHTANAKGTRLTHNNPWLKRIRLARQEVVHFKARDGLDIGGVLVHPLNRKKGSKVPLILAVHGGPEYHVSNGWTTYYARPGQVGAAQGFAVFHPNYRGSTGRGVAFSKMGQNDYAGGEFNDLVDCVQHFIKSGLADGQRIGITGGSYGGYASAWGATRLTRHFAASVMFVGISDLISKFGTTDIPNESFLVHSRRWPWKAWDTMRERSPITYVEQARTPILILHGDSDPRVHPGQSLELFRYLKTIGKVPVRLVLYKGEGHGNRRASSRYDYNLRMMRWFKHYLQAKGGAKPTWRLDYALPESGKAAQPE